MGMLKRFPTEILILHKQSGETCDVKALIDPKGSEVFIDDASVVIEEDDYFQRNLSNGAVEFYLVTERGFTKGMGTISDHYQTKVKKIKEPPAFDRISSEKPRLIFISHSTKDKPYTKAFVDLLEGIGLDDEQIVCSSYPGLGVPLDAPVFDWLVSRFQDYDLHVLYFLSHNYYNSAASLNEMGAAWAMKHRWTAVLLPGFGFSDIDGCVDPRQISIKIDGDREELKVRLFELKQNLVAEFGLKDLSPIKWERVRDQFLKTVDEIEVEEIDEPAPESRTVEIDSSVSIFACVMLMYAAEGDGRIMVISNMTSTSYSAGSTQMERSQIPRELAHWENAVKQLVSKRWIELVGKKDRIYKVTEIGYNISDSFKTDNQLDPSKNPSEILAEFGEPQE